MLVPRQDILRRELGAQDRSGVRQRETAIAHQIGAVGVVKKARGAQWVAIDMPGLGTTGVIGRCVLAVMCRVVQMDDRMIAVARVRNRSRQPCKGEHESQRRAQKPEPLSFAVPHGDLAN